MPSAGTHLQNFGTICLRISEDAIDVLIIYKVYVYMLRNVLYINESETNGNKFCRNLKLETETRQSQPQLCLCGNSP